MSDTTDSDQTAAEFTEADFGFDGDMEETDSEKFQRLDTWKESQYIEKRMIPRGARAQSRLWFETGEINPNTGRGKNEYREERAFKKAASDLGRSMRVDFTHMTTGERAGQTLLRLMLQPKRVVTEEEKAKREKARKESLRKRQEEAAKAAADSGNAGAAPAAPPAAPSAAKKQAAPAATAANKS